MTTPRSAAPPAPDASAPHPHAADLRRRRVSAGPARPTGTPLSGLIGRNGLFQIAVIVAGMLWLYWDHCVRLLRYWSKDPDWSHGFLIPLFSLYFVYTRRDDLAARPIRPSWLGLPVLIAAVWGYFWAIYRQFGYPQPLSIVLAIAGLVLLFCGWRVLRITAFAIGFLILALPPPVRMYREITQPLQQFAAIGAELVLQFLPGVVIERSGINLAYETDAGASGSFTVAGACSGMRSLMAFIALGLAMAYFAPRPLWHRVVMALVVMPVAVFCNIVRVILTGSFQIYDYGNLAAGTPHTILGILTFALGFAIYFALLYVLDHLFVPDDASRPPAEVAA